MALENGPGLKMIFLLKMGIFQPAMWVYHRVHVTCVISQAFSTNPTRCFLFSEWGRWAEAVFQWHIFGIAPMRGDLGPKIGRKWAEFFMEVIVTSCWVVATQRCFMFTSPPRIGFLRGVWWFPSSSLMFPKVPQSSLGILRVPPLPPPLEHPPPLRTLQSTWGNDPIWRAYVSNGWEKTN